MLYAFCIFFPFWLFMEGQKLTEHSLGANSSIFSTLLMVFSGSFCLYWQEAAGFWFLTATGPVAHAMGNGLRGVVVITYGAWYFSTPFGPLNAIGSLVAVAAIVLYGYAGNSGKKAKIS